MATLAQLETWRDDLLAARGKPAAEVEYDGKRVKFRSDADLARAIADMERRIAAAQSGGRIRTVYATTSKGV
ncbi:MAG TPA: hypothetical protein PLV61_01400 [Parvularculaceae bacterium]|nr:hypothetical protein [Amphiplicatus sp.]HPE29814.1 hypothetical protein [Parvularculaceae bacterium]HRX40527.1 hypothetical protein [Parvularculaceae bacterium]